MIDDKNSEVSLEKRIVHQCIDDGFANDFITTSQAVPSIPIEPSDDSSKYPIKPPRSAAVKKPTNRMLQTYSKPSIYHPASARYQQKKRVDPRRNKGSNSKSPRIRKDRQKYDNLSPATLEYLSNPVAIPKTLGELQRTVRELESLREFHVKSENYPEAEGIQRLIQSARKKIKYTVSNPPDVESCVVKHKELQQVVQRILTQWNEQYDEFVQTTQTEYYTLMTKHEKELEEFDAKSPDQLTPQYRKRSVALLESRSKEKRLAINNQLAAAKQLKAKNDEIENKEAMQQYERMQNDYLKRRERLISQQEEQVRVFISHADSARTKMLQTRANLLQGYLKRIEKLNTEIAEICETQNIDPDTLDDINLPIDRVVKIENIELQGSPIPAIRKQTFTSIRQKIRRRRKERKEKKGEEEEEEKEEEEKEEEIPPLFATVSNSVDEFKEVIAETKETEEEEEATEQKIEEEEEINEQKIEEEETIEQKIEEEEEEEKVEQKIEEEEEVNEQKEEEEVVVYGRNDVTDMTFFTSTIATFANENHDDHNNINHKKFMDPNEELESKDNENEEKS